MGFSLFVGCKWQLVSNTCDTLLFDQASANTEFGDTFPEQILFNSQISKDDYNTGSQSTEPSTTSNKAMMSKIIC